MGTEKLRRQENPTPLAEGEFWRITGIGETTQQRLHSVGINTFRQLASLSTEEFASILTGQVGVKERAARQDWAGQARNLSEALENEERRMEALELANRLHYESFLVELLIEDECNIKRTRITLVRSGDKASWAGWDSQRLFSWLAEQTHLPIEKFGTTKSAIKPPDPEKPAGVLSGTISATNISFSARNSSQQKRFFTAGQPLELQLTLDLSKTQTSSESKLTYHAIAEARNVETGKRIRLSEIQEECAAAEQLNLTIPIPGMEEGTYFFETAVQLMPEDGSTLPGETGLNTLCEAGLIHIYARELEPVP